MRGIEFLLLVGFIGLIGVSVWNAEELFPQWHTRPVSYAPVDSTRAQPGTETGKAVHVHGKRGLNSLNRGSARDDLAVSSLPVSETEVDVPLPKFPVRTDFPKGATGTEIRARYGEPAARTTEMRDGHLFEHYYYFNNDRTQLTMATLENGVIVSSESTAP